MKKNALFGSFSQNSTRNSSRIPSLLDGLAVCAFIRPYLIAEWGALLNQIQPGDYGGDVTNTELCWQGELPHAPSKRLGTFLERAFFGDQVEQS
jgi:hypothetical protein